MKKLILIAASASLMFVSCSKEDTPNPNNNNNNNNNPSSTVLTTGSWKMISSVSVIEYPAPIGTQTVDLFNLMQSCVQDNLYTFKTDNNMMSDEGASKCNSADPQEKSVGTWALLDNNTKLQMNDPSSGMSTITADVLTLNSTTLEVRYVTSLGGMNSTTTTKYTH